MTLRTIGATGLAVHPLCLGTNIFGWTIDEPQSFAVLDSYAAAGGNFLDTADSYSAWIPGNNGGESETIIGKWLAASGRSGELPSFKNAISSYQSADSAAMNSSRPSRAFFLTAPWMIGVQPKSSPLAPSACFDHL